MYLSSVRRSGVPENGRAPDRLKGDASSNQARACTPHAWFVRTIPGTAREVTSRPMASKLTHWTDGCLSRRWGDRSAQDRPVAKQNIDCKVLKCTLPIQLSFLTSCNCTQRGCSYPPLKHLAPPGTGYCAHWSAGLGCCGNSWLPELFIFPLQWPTKRCTGSSARFLWVGPLTLCTPASPLLFKKQQRKRSHPLAAKQLRACNPCPAELCGTSS